MVEAKKLLRITLALWTLACLLATAALLIFAFYHSNDRLAQQAARRLADEFHAGLQRNANDVVADREAIIQFLNSKGGTVTLHSAPGEAKARLRKPIPAAWARLGAEPVSYIVIPSDVFRMKPPGPYSGMDGYMRIESLFPEAVVIVKPRTVVAGSPVQTQARP